jgi:hypothetical protein
MLCPAGSKFIAAMSGGKLSLHGRPVARRWTRLQQPAAAGAASIVLDGSSLGWLAGGAPPPAFSRQHAGVC